MIDLRIYRATFILALFAAIVAMFSLKPEPKPQHTTLAPDAFDGVAARSIVRQLTAAVPKRSPGSRADNKAADLVAERLDKLGYHVTRQHFKGSYKGHQVGLQNVIGVLSGALDSRIVIIAHRDSTAALGAGTSGTSTAALLELANDLHELSHHKTVVLVSSDGATLGALGANYFAHHLADTSKIDATIVLDDLGARNPRQPFLLPWSASSQNTPLQLVRTVDRALRLEVGKRSSGVGLIGQFIRLALPLTAREQGVVLAAGVPAVTISSHGELPRKGASDSLAQVSPTVLGNFGRTALASYLALDRSERLELGQKRYMVVASRVLPGWTVSLLVIALLIPALFAAIDAFARARRWREHIAKWTLWVSSASLPFLAALLLGHLLAQLGLLPDLPSGVYNITPEPVNTSAAFAWAAIVLLIVAVVLLRHRRAKHFKIVAGTAAAPGAAVALGLLLGMEVFAVWLLNPFAAAMMLPAAHAWMLAVQPGTGNRPLPLALLVISGLVLPALALTYYVLAFDIGSRIFYDLVLVFAGNTFSLLQGVLLALLAGSFTAVLSIVCAKIKNGRIEQQITVRGPKTYAGPGSLGGTDSAFGR